MTEHIKTGQNILGIFVNAIRVDKALNYVQQYLDTDQTDIIFFVNTKEALLAKENEEYAQFVNGLDMVLPGDKNIEESLPDEVQFDSSTLYMAEFLKQFFVYLNRNKKSIFVLMDTEEQLQKFIQYGTGYYPKAYVEGRIYQEDQESIDSMINDINVLAPDVLILGTDYKTHKQFLEKSKNKMNTKLCLCVDTINAKKHKPIPELFQKMHLEKLYSWFFQKNKINHAIDNKVFHNKMKTEEQNSDLPKEEK